MTNRSELSLGMPLRFRPQHAAGGSIYDFGEAFTYPNGLLTVVTNFWVVAPASTLTVTGGELASGGGSVKTNPLNDASFLTKFDKNFTFRLSIAANFTSLGFNDVFRIGIMDDVATGQEMGLQFENHFFNGFRYGTFYNGGASVDLTPFDTNTGNHVLLGTFNVSGTRYKIDATLDSVPIVDTQSALGYVDSALDVKPFMGTTAGFNINPGSPMLNMQYTADEP